MKYILCVKREFSNVYWEIIEINGYEKNISEYFAKYVFYNGDDNVENPLSYVKDIENGNKIIKAYLIHLNDAYNLLPRIEKIEKYHLKIHNENEQKQIEALEIKEYNRLKEKYGNL